MGTVIYTTSLVIVDVPLVDDVGRYIDEVSRVGGREANTVHMLLRSATAIPRPNIPQTD